MRKIIYKMQKKFSRSCCKNINYETMSNMLKQNKNIIVIDVRIKEEFKCGHLDRAINIPMQDIKEQISKIVKNKDSILIVYCEYGGRSKKACNKLEKMGYTNVYNLDGGLEAI